MTTVLTDEAQTIGSARYRCLEIQSNKTKATILIASGSHSYVSVTIHNAAHKAFRGSGKQFKSIAAAYAHYKSADMKEILSVAAEIASVTNLQNEQLVNEPDAVKACERQIQRSQARLEALLQAKRQEEAQNVQAEDVLAKMQQGLQVANSSGRLFWVSDDGELIGRLTSSEVDGLDRLKDLGYIKAYNKHD